MCKTLHQPWQQLKESKEATLSGEHRFGELEGN
jgi:hypothetical protein